MANNFSGITVLPFQGVTYRLPVKLPQGVAVPANQVPPSICPVAIDWTIYWQLLNNPSNVGVSVNLQASSVYSSILDRIASVKIDNTGSNCSIYVQFPDTGDVINCPPNCSVTFPCLTNNLIANIYAKDLLTGFIPTTKIYFYNAVLPPAVDFEVSQSVALYRSSPSLVRGGFANLDLGPPALGDQTIFCVVALASVGETLLLPAQPSGRFYITGCEISVVVPTFPNTEVIFAQVRQDVTLNIIFNAPILATPNPPLNVQTIFRQSGMNINLDATLRITYHNNTGISGGSAYVTLIYTYQP